MRLEDLDGTIMLQMNLKYKWREGVDSIKLLQNMVQ